MQDLPLNAMLVFAKVVEAGSFSGAGRALHMATSAVSRHVTKLESCVGGALLQRTTRAFVLTELGQEVYAACVRLTDAAHEVAMLGKQYGDEPRGLLKVSAPVTFGQFWLTPRLSAFIDRYPQLNLNISMTDRLVDLVEDGMDLAIRVTCSPAPGLVARHLCDVHYRLVASATYLSRHGTPKQPQDLHQHCCVCLGYEPFGTEWPLIRDGELVSVQVNQRITLSHSAAIQNMVSAGGGIGLIPDFVADAAFVRGELVPVLPEWQFSARYQEKAYAVYTPTRHLPLKARVFIDYLVECHALKG